MLGKTFLQAFGCVTLPHYATARQRNGWPGLTTMREFLCLWFPHPLWRKHVCVRVFSVLNQNAIKRCLQWDLSFAAQDKTKGFGYFITCQLHQADVNGAIISLFLNINISAVASTSSLLSRVRKWDKYIQGICLCLAEIPTCPRKVDLTNLGLCSQVLSWLCLKTMAPTITVK